MTPTQLVMNGQARSLVVEPTNNPTEWVVLGMAPARGKPVQSSLTVAVMDDFTQRKCTVVPDNGRLILRLVS